jgi:hypothetical protein
MNNRLIKAISKAFIYSSAVIGSIYLALQIGISSKIFTLGIIYFILCILSIYIDYLDM